MDTIYVYFISYMHKTGYGRSEYQTKKKISCIEDIVRMEEALMERAPYAQGLCIMNYQLVEKRKEPKEK